MCFFFQAEDGIRDLVRSRGLGDVYKRQRFDRNKYSIASKAVGRPVDIYAYAERIVIKQDGLSLIHI